MSAPRDRRLESIGLVVLDVETRDGFVGVSVPSATALIGDAPIDPATLGAVDLRVDVPAGAQLVPVVAVLADPFPRPASPRGQPIAAPRVDSVFSALERRQPRSHRVAPAWHADRRAVRVLDAAFRSSSAVAPVLPDDDEAPPTVDAPALSVAVTERAVWPDEPCPPSAPEHLPLDVNDDEAWHAPDAWPTVLLEVMSSSEGAGREALRSISERFEAIGDVRRALIARAALGDDDAREQLLAAAGAAGLSSRPVAAFLANGSGERRRDGLEPLVELEASGRRLEVAAAIEALAIVEGDAALAELAATSRATLALPRALDVELNGEHLRLVLADAPTLGRLQADVVVPGALVSRRHLGFRRVDGIPVVVDLGSHNGTDLEGEGRMTGARAIAGALRLRLGGSVPCALAPHPLGVALEIAGARRVLTLGPLALGALTLTASRGAVVCSGRGTLGGRGFSGPIELALGDVIRDAAGLELRVRDALG